MKKKKTYLICIAAILLALLSGKIIWDNYHGTEKEAVKVAVFAYKKSDVFISDIIGSMEKMAYTYEEETGIPVQIDVLDAKENQNDQDRQLDKCLQLDYDVFCVNLVDRTTASVVVDKTEAEGIPLIFFNREPVEQDIKKGKNVYYIGADAKGSAVLQGKMIADLYVKSPEELDLDKDGDVEYVMMEGQMGHQDAIIRTEWSIKTIRSAGVPLKAVESGVANFERSQGAALMEQWLQKGDDIELVICNNDEMALGAVDAIEKMGIKKDIKIVGIDGIADGIQAVKEGKMYGTVICNSKQQGESMFTLAVSLALNGEPDKSLKLTNERYIRAELDGLLSQ